MSEPVTVVKVGGSLFDLPDLDERLRTFLDGLGGIRVLLLPGGGPFADVIRALDGIHAIGEEASHWLALHALSLSARFLATRLPGAILLGSLAQLPQEARHVLVDSLPFFAEDEPNAGRLPHRWDVTSDSLAVRLASRAGAGELVLLKSVAWPAADAWETAAAAGVVDGYFCRALSGAAGLRVRVVNLREAAPGARRR